MVTLLVMLAHIAVGVGLGFSSRMIPVLLALNVAASIAILAYAGTRARYILAASDWPYLVLIVFEGLVLSAAMLALRDSRWAMVLSYVVFGLHACASVAGVVFAFAFRITKLM